MSDRGEFLARQIEAECYDLAGLEFEARAPGLMPRPLPVVVPPPATPAPVVTSVPQQRKCTKCRRTLMLAKGFYRHQRGRDGYTSHCRRCIRQRVANHRDGNIEQVRAQARARYATDPEFRAKRAAYYAQYRKTARGRESRRITQRVYRATLRAEGRPPPPADRPEAKRARYYANKARQ